MDYISHRPWKDLGILSEELRRGQTGPTKNDVYLWHDKKK